MSQQFGDNPDYYRPLGQNGHTGIDYACWTGTPVRASGDGVVAFEGWGQNHGGFLKVAGIAVLVDHGDVYTGYAHLSSTTVNIGQRVKQGEIIGYSGATGQVMGPHLHFEFWGKPTSWKNGWAGRVNPNDYLSAISAQEDEEMQPTSYEVANIYAQALLFRDMSREEWQAHHSGKSRNQLFDEFNGSQERRDRLAEIANAIAASKTSAADKGALAEALSKAQAAQAEMERLKVLADEAEAKAKSEADARAELEAQAEADKAAGDSIARRIGQFITKYLPGSK
ncbi:M23 family metallopeptidase [Rhodococcus ruber]|uniref:M23 family metallopeptidase n=1 Tax=Rhodococcus ruber TaxID=1830 RepID=UPI001F2B7C31|nr:M23 family metallopeptidase [Rhodococcus ruber]MCF8783184.1 peptidoglycan DD-metalloendopeptidase family protein [Rhodococcus ruber]